MPTPPKPASLLKSENKSHRTKAELEQREKAEKSLLTGIRLKPSKQVKENKVAFQEFKRIKKLLKSIDKDDDLYGNSINRYCLIFSECIEFENRQKELSLCLKDLEKSKQEIITESSTNKYYEMWGNINKNIISIDRQLQTKRRMLFDIERENVMTVASALRSVPKKVEDEINPLLEALADE